MKYRYSTILLLLILLLGAVMPAVLAQGEIIGSTSGDLNVRTGPGTDFPVIATLPLQAQVVVEGRNQIGDWILVHTPDSGVRGWVASRFVYLPEGVPVQSLGVVDEVVSAPAAAAPGNPAAGNTGSGTESLNPIDPAAYGPVPVPAMAKADVPTMIARLESIPNLYNFGSGAIRSIYATGQALGNRSRVFTRVGDSITANQPFLIGFGNAGNYNLGNYPNLQDTINYFSESPRPGYKNSFEYDSLAARSAFNAGAVLDRLWTDGSLCDPETEAPLQCEYRLAKPSIAIIMLGSVDMQIYDLQRYTDFMDHIVKISVDSGVIPVLTTFPIPPDYIYYETSLRFNMVILDVADRYGVPVINLWQAARQLPDNGVGGDRYHLSQGPTFFSFAGEETQYGVTLRNLLTLQALDELRRGIPLR